MNGKHATYIGMLCMQLFAGEILEKPLLDTQKEFFRHIISLFSRFTQETTVL